MQYKRLGKTDLNVSTVGFGTWGFANDPGSWVGATKKESEKALLKAIDLGINFIDTASIYGEGLAEEWIGEILHRNPRNKIIVSSKIYPLNQEWSGMKGTDISLAFPKKHIVNVVNHSLKSLKKDYLDLMYFHVWEDEWSNKSEWQETVKDLTKQGKVRYWGISTNDYEPTNCLEACKSGLISVVMTIFNLFYQEPIQLLFPEAKRLEVGLVARVPFDEGGLTGKITTNTRFPDGDFRQTYFSANRIKELEKHIAKLQPFIKGDIHSVAELALRYILSFEEIGSTVLGMRNIQHVIENSTYTQRSGLNQKVLLEITDHAWKRNFYDDE